MQDYSLTIAIVSIIASLPIRVVAYAWPTSGWVYRATFISGLGFVGLYILLVAGVYVANTIALHKDT